MKILIAGDSFAADWSTKYDGTGWPNLLANVHDVTNIAQAGCGEYKIYQQLTQQDLAKYDSIIVSHTSPYRIHVSDHPIHKNDQLHYNSDFIYQDVKEHGLKSVTEFFEKYFDLEYAEFVHTLISQKINELTQPYRVIHITHFDWKNLYKFPNFTNFYNLHKKYPGLINHYSSKGNCLIFSKISKLI